MQPSSLTRGAAAAVVATFLVACLCAPSVAMAAEATGDVVISAEPGSASRVLSQVREAGGVVTQDLYTPGAYTVEPPAGQSAIEFARELESVPGVAHAQAEKRMRALYVPDDTFYATGQWNMRLIGMPLAWDLTLGSPSVSVAVIDTGFDMTHDDRPVHLDTANAWDFIENDAVPNDEYNHGTHVAGIIAAATNNGEGVAGIAPGCSIMPVRVLDETGWGSDPDVADGIRWAVDRGADVINLSLGGEDSQIIDDAIDYAVSKDVLVVAASGNDAWASGYVPGTVPFPAALPGVVAVGAVTTSTARAPYSQYGPALDIVAPGGSGSAGVYSLYAINRYAAMQGTSMASPHVAGVAALIRSQHPTWTAGDVEQQMALTAQDLGDLGRDDSFGWGMLRADLALNPLAIAPSVLDSDIPGLPLFTSPALGSIDATTDAHDVLRVEASAGQSLSIELTGTPEAEADLALFAPGTTSISFTEPLAVSANPGSSEKISYAGTQAGTYFVDVSGAGAGEYQLTADSAWDTALTSKAASTCSWGGTAPITGKLTRQFDGAGVAGRALTAQYLNAAGVWTKAGSTTTKDDGTFSVNVKPTRRTLYRVFFAGTASYYQQYGPTVTITPRAYLTSPSAPSRVYKNRTFTSTGYLRPKHTTGAKTVTIKCYRWESNAWKLRKSVAATNKYYSTATTKYSASVKLPYTGKWKLVAYVPGDSTHVTTTSSGRYRTAH